MSRRYFCPIHINGGNRGCEGIAKGTAEILNVGKENILGLCSDVELDKHLNVDKYVTLIERKKKIPFLQRVIRKIRIALEGNVYEKKIIHISYEFKSFFESISSNDIMLSTGGDMMCYDDNYVNTTNDLIHRKGIKTILWGCSMGPENLTSEKENTLHNFSLIYARESLSYEFLKSLGLKNVVCLPDPAFVLKPEVTDLPNVFETSDVIGINLSSFVLGKDTLTSPFAKEVISFIEFIIRESSFHVLLIPHVMWPQQGQDDIAVLNAILELFKSSNRVSMLDSAKLNYLQIRYVISKCRFFIGARTHAVISAYSACIPTIALGYSVKSVGIAKDLGLPGDLVINSKGIIAKNCLINSFNYLLSHELEIRDLLVREMTEYCKMPFRINDIINKL